MYRCKVHDLDLWTLTVVRAHVTTDKVALPMFSFAILC